MNQNHDYFAILIGLGFGLAAHVGRLFADGGVPRPLSLLGYVLQLGVIGLIASVATKQFGITEPDMRALIAALLAISTQEVVQLMKRRTIEAVRNHPSPLPPTE